MKKLKIMVKNDEKVYEGTPLSIIKQMKSFAWNWEDRPTADYIDWMVSQLQTMTGVKIETDGGSLKKRAERFIDGILKNGLAEELK